MSDYRLTLVDGTLLLRDADGAPHTSRVSDVIADAEALEEAGQPGLARAVLMAMGIWLDQLLARVEVALDGARRADN